MESRALSEDQARTFNVEYCFGVRWELLRERLTRHFADRPFTVLDVGGGNGMQVDAILKAFPASTATVLEPAEVLLATNTAHPRKTLVRGTATTLPDKHYDLILVHWLLHHLVGDTYRATVREQIRTLGALGDHLTLDGRISAFENIYSGYLVGDLPGRLLYEATALRVAASLSKRCGANTAGVGVAFHSRRRWRAMIAEAGLVIDSYAEPDTWTWPVRALWRVGLTLQDIRTGHFWLRSSSL